MAMSICLSVCSSVCRIKRVLLLAARVGYADYGCPKCLFPVNNFTREVYASGGGLLVASINAPNSSSHCCG